jgi:hypothetical protein
MKAKTLYRTTSKHDKGYVMKLLTSGFSYQRFVKIILLGIMLSAIIVLWGVPPIVSECPFNFEYKYIPLSLTSNIGSRFAFTYTISLDPERVTKYDKQRTYRLYSEFYAKRKKHYGSFRTISTDIQNGQAFTYSQFPITGHLKIKCYGGIQPLFFDIDVIGYAVKGDQGTAMPADNKYVQQYSSFTMGLPDEVGILDIIWGIFNRLLEKLGYKIITSIIIVTLGIVILFFVIKRILRINKVNA